MSGLSTPYTGRKGLIQPSGQQWTPIVEMRAQAVEPTTDRELADRIANAGDEAAFRELYGRHTPRLYQFVLRVLGGDELEAEDVVQDAWMRAARNLEGFRWESRFDTWLTGIGLNLCRNLLRRSGRWEDLRDDAHGTTRSAAREDRIDLERAIAMLPARCRAVLILHDVEGFRHAEIAARLGVTEGTSKSQLWLARRHMRRLLNEGAAPQGEPT